SAQIREILISESAWEEMTCLFAPSLDIFSSRQLSAHLSNIVEDMPGLFTDNLRCYKRTKNS
ncbi:hypothetical protein SBS71_11875, partial [Klebsiella pneumoniae]|nr:hypothetical protein [Klebsiella pneumoniae]MDW5789994.1 hypothetical protein [Klebsiella pneumoniae]MDW5795622.1 hypothetical protein [Klebsiella pneumoniae]MDW5965424.1 hypothetical protein [Klebsiella pneumoniae]